MPILKKFRPTFNFLLKLIIIFLPSCSGNDSKNIKKVSEKELTLIRKKNGIMREKKYEIIETSKFGILKKDSFLLTEKQYNSDGILIKKTNTWYDPNNRKVHILICSEYYENGIIKCEYDSTFHFENEPFKFIAEINKKEVPINFISYKNEYNLDGKKTRSFTVTGEIGNGSNEKYLAKGIYTWLNDTTCDYKFYDYDGTLESSTQTMFDSKNRILKEINHINNGKIIRKFEYNINGDLTKKYYSDGSWEEFLIINKLIHEKKYYISDTIASRNVYEYDKYKNETKNKVYNKDGTYSLIENKYKYDNSGNIIFKETIGKNSYEYKYDEFGNNIFMAENDKKGELIYSKTFKYDTLNNLIEEIKYDNQGKVKEKFVTYYDHF